MRSNATREEAAILSEDKVVANYTDDSDNNEEVGVERKKGDSQGRVRHLCHILVRAYQTMVFSIRNHWTQPFACRPWQAQLM